MKRRLFLHNTLLGIPAIMLAPTLLAGCKDDESDLPDVDYDGKVIVIGAGIAGMYAAHLLKSKNVNVQILEASATFGGRIRELVGFADFPIELGAEEIHGNKTDWYDFVTSTPGVQLVDVDDEDYYILDGQIKTEGQLSADPDAVNAETFIEQATNYSGTDMTATQKLDQQGIPNRVRHFVNAQVGNEYGTDNNTISLKGITEEDQLWTAGNGNYGVKNRSYKSILQEKLGDILNSITYNTQVKNINYSDNQIVLTDQNNTTHLCDKLIITIPLGVLKAGDVTFNPGLPADKTDAIAKIGMGPGMKIILKFNTRFWQDDLGSLYGTGNVPEFWYTSFGRGNNPVLTAFVMGEKAATLSNLSPQDAIQSVLAELNGFYGNNAATNAFADGIVMDWGKEPFVKGAYSFPIVGGGISKRQALANPMGDRLYFAGEATHFEGHSATAHGAFETGFRAVKQMLEAIAG